MTLSQVALGYVKTQLAGVEQRSIVHCDAQEHSKNGHVYRPAKVLPTFRRRCARFRSETRFRCAWAVSIRGKMPRLRAKLTGSGASAARQKKRR